MSKNKLTKFTNEEQKDILREYSAWMIPENIIWVVKVWKESLQELPRYKNQDTEKYIETHYSCVKNSAEKIWVFDRLKDYHFHSSPYIDSRIDDYTIKDFRDETDKRIILEEIESKLFDIGL